MRKASDRFGEGTIEKAFLDDVGAAFDFEDEAVTVFCREEHEVDTVILELNEIMEGYSTVGTREVPIVSVVYILTVPAPMKVRSGDDVVVSGFESDWVFSSIKVLKQSESETKFDTGVIYRDE